MQIPIVNGVYTDLSSDVRTSYPVNLVPVAKKQGVSNGYLRPADGLIASGEGPGTNRGAINWRNSCYRVMGTKLCRIDEDESIHIIGDIGGSTQVSLDYSFDYLAVASGGRLYYYDGGTLQQVTDVDLGTIIDFIWIDGYFLGTDGEFIIATDLDDPFSVNPVKYGSSEIDPDPIVGLLSMRNEVYALNRYTIEVFNNVGGSGFTFARIEGAQIQKGVVGTHCACVLEDRIAFIGGGRNEQLGIYLGANGSAEKISTDEIDTILEGYSEAEVSTSLVEARISKTSKYLYIHLPDRTLVFDPVATALIGELVWFTLSSSVLGYERYRAKNFVWCYNKWLIGDANTFQYGYTTDETSHHFGDTVGWEFNTNFIYNESKGGIIHELELVALTGRIEVNKDPVVWTSYSFDGLTFSMEKAIKCGKIGETNKRLRWLEQGIIRNFRIQKFRGTSDANISMLRLEANVEALNV